MEFVISSELQMAVAAVIGALARHLRLVQTKRNRGPVPVSFFVVVNATGNSALAGYLATIVPFVHGPFEAFVFGYFLDLVIPRLKPMIASPPTQNRPRAKAEIEKRQK